MGRALTTSNAVQFAYRRCVARCQALDAVDQFVAAARLALAGTLHELFWVAAAVTAIALVATLFLSEVPLGAKAERPQEELIAA